MFLLVTLWGFWPSFAQSKVLDVVKQITNAKCYCLYHNCKNIQKLKQCQVEAAALHKSPIESLFAKCIGVLNLPRECVRDNHNKWKCNCQWMVFCWCLWSLFACVHVYDSSMDAIIVVVANSSRQQPLSLKCTHWYFVPLSKHTIGHGKIYFGKDSSMFYTCIIYIW